MKSLILALVLPILFTIWIIPISAQEFDTKHIKEELAEMINQYRVQNGLGPWQYNKSIEAVALAHSKDMIQRSYFEHLTLGTNVGPDLRGAKAGFGLCGENRAIEIFEEANLASYKFWKLYRSYNQKENPTYVEYKELEEQKKRVDNLMKVSGRLFNDGRIFIGFGENIAWFENYKTKDIPQAALQGWIDSPEHHELLIGHGNEMGIGIFHDSKNVKVTLNVC